MHMLFITSVSARQGQYFPRHFCYERRFIFIPGSSVPPVILIHSFILFCYARSVHSCIFDWLNILHTHAYVPTYLGSRHKLSCEAVKGKTTRSMNNTYSLKSLNWKDRSSVRSDHPGHLVYHAAVG